MCGICGFIHFEGQPVKAESLRAMNNMLRHRGPDEAGYHIDGNVGLAMRRLKIIDIGGSQQPLTNEDGALQLIFNGEIYNYRALRQSLAARGHRFKTAGDGETIIHLYEDYGAAAPQHLRGMFAFALWDARQGRLLLARDRLGQKPLYYYQDQHIFAFASEIKALLALSAVPRRSRFDSEPGTLADYLSFGYVPAPATAFAGIYMLEPARTLQIDLAGAAQKQTYWQLGNLAPPKPAAKAAEYQAQLRAELDEAVKLRLISDVPLGVFLSGGLDSSLIVALMRRHSNAAIKTFSIGFAGDDSFDESPWAEQVARQLGTEHHSFRVEPTALRLLPDLVWHHDQPFADSSAIPTYLVSKLTRAHVTVALTGDGGDELFAGYERFYAAALFRKLGFLPRFLCSWLAGWLARLPEGTAYYDPLKRARRFLHAAGRPLPEAYFDLLRVFSSEQLAALGVKSVASLSPYLDAAQPHPVAALLEANLHSYLPDDLLIKTDRCTMQASLEARAPFLDHQLAEYAAGIPFNLKLKGATTKHILKETARGLLPEAIIHRPKHGFGIPLGAWLRQEMGPTRDILLSRRARERGLLPPTALERLIDEHESGRRDHNRQLWALLTLEEWQRQFLDAPKIAPPSAC